MVIILLDSTPEEYHQSGLKYHFLSKYDKAFAKFLYAAHKNHAPSQYHLGIYYYYGLSIDGSDKAMAFQWFKKSFNNGYSKARFKIGEIYYNEYGYYSETDYKQAIYFLKNVKDENEIPTCYYIARMFFKGGYGIKKNYKQALFWFLKYDNMLSYDDSLILARIYTEGGFGIQKDFKAAESWALKYGWNKSYVILGMIYFKGGHGIEKNYVTAYNYWSKCDEFDKPYYMGILYTLRDDDEQDFEKGFLFLKSIPQGYHSTCDVLIGLFYEKGLGVEQDYEQAMIWYEKANTKNKGISFIRMGWLYQKGLGVKQDYKKAFELYENAAKFGNKNTIYGDAMASLGVLYQDGLGVTQSYSKAKEYFQRSMDVKNSNGYNNMGNVYRYGYGVDINYRKAFQFYLECEKCYDDSWHVWNGDFRLTLRFCDEGWLNLGFMYLRGLGTYRSIQLGFKYLEKALIYGNEETQIYVDQIIDDLYIGSASVNQIDTVSQDAKENSDIIISDLEQSRVDDISVTIPKQEQSRVFLYVEDVKNSMPVETRCRRFLYVEDCTSKSTSHDNAT